MIRDTMSGMSQCVTQSLSVGPTVENEVKEPEERGWRGVEVRAPFQPLRDDGTCQGTEGADAILTQSQWGDWEKKDQAKIYWKTRQLSEKEANKLHLIRFSEERYFMKEKKQLK